MMDCMVWISPAHALIISLKILLAAVFCQHADGTYLSPSAFSLRYGRGLTPHTSYQNDVGICKFVELRTLAMPFGTSGWRRSWLSSWGVCVGSKGLNMVGIVGKLRVAQSSRDRLKVWVPRKRGGQIANMSHVCAHYQCWAEGCFWIESHAKKAVKDTWQWVEGFGAASGATPPWQRTHICTVIFCAASLFPNCSSPLKSAQVRSWSCSCSGSGCGCGGGGGGCCCCCCCYCYCYCYCCRCCCCCCCRCRCRCRCRCWCCCCCSCSFFSVS